MEHWISNGLLRVNLQATKRISGHNYARLLEQAGLGRYGTQLPPPNDQPACSAEEYSRLPEAVFAMLGESLTRLFLRNAGSTMVERTMRHPQMVTLASHLHTLPREARLSQFMPPLTRLANQTWAAATTVEDETAHYLLISECPTCRSLHDLSAPICANSESFYAGIATASVGYRVRVVEVECVATGGTVCRFAFYK